MIRFRQKGDFTNISSFLTKAKRADYRSIIEKFANEGLNALQANTPKDTGLTAASWAYEIVQSQSGFSIYWTNSNLVEGIPVVILLQYGHGTGTGAYVHGIDFINPAIRPIFDRITEDIWKEVNDL